MAVEVDRAVEGRGAFDVASGALQRSSAIFRYAIKAGRVTYNPAADKKGLVKTRRVEHRSASSRLSCRTFSRNWILIPANCCV